MSMGATIDKKEIDHFAKDSSHWWDEDGPFKPLHRLNPVRMGYIKNQICVHFDHDTNCLNALEGLDIIDIGCGGGLVTEPLKRMGANVTGIDADENALKVASEHAKKSNLDIDYVLGDAGALHEKFDVVVSLEVIEHVSDPANFVKLCCDRLKPGGLLIMSTLNRTPKSYALGIVAAEYVLGWVPKGTHKWKKFVKPSEIIRHARAHGLKPVDTTGLIYNPLKNEFTLSETDLDVNYLITLKGD